MSNQEIYQQIENIGAHVHLLLYSPEKENDPQFTEWRADLESAISDWIDAHKLLATQDERKRIMQILNNAREYKGGHLIDHILDQILDYES